MTIRILVVAGSDSGAGAGIQADLKTIAALGGYATTALTALTAQNTLGVEAVLPVPPDFVRRQMEAVLDDIGADAIKTGMLHDAATIAVVAEIIAARAPQAPLVVDPVMISTSGTRLLDAAATSTLLERLVPRAALLTPNLPEAAALTGTTLRDRDDMARAAQKLVAHGAAGVLVKGGHAEGATVTDVYCDAEGRITEFHSPRIETRHTHGTGCTLASAIALGLGEGLTPVQAIERARTYLEKALSHPPKLGAGHGPLGHMHVLQRISK